MLVFQLQRASFDRISKSFSKITKRFAFEDVLYLDQCVFNSSSTFFCVHLLTVLRRYLEVNQQVTLQRRIEVDLMRHRLRETLAAIDHLEHFEVGRCSLLISHNNSIVRASPCH